MVTRISTMGAYQSVLANLMHAQQAQLDAGDRVSTQKNATDLKGYASNDELLTSMQSLQVKLTSFSTQNNLVSDKLSAQDTALGQVSGAAQNARSAIADALSSGNGTNLMATLQGAMNQAVGAMNTQYNGVYLFAGGQINTQPVTAQQLSDLTSGPPVSSFFKNDQFKAKAQVDVSTSVTTGVLASDIGTPMMNALQAIEAFNQGPNGPITGTLTPAQSSFLESQLSVWTNVEQGVTDVNAQNGLVQQQVTAVGADITSQQTTLTEMLSNITDADMGKAASDLQMAQTSFAAAAQVFQSLKDSSLLNLLQIQ